MLVVEFDNSRVATCGTEAVNVAVPEGAERITKVIVLSGENRELGFYLAKAMDPDAAKWDVGTAGELALYEYRKPELFPWEELSGRITIGYMGGSGKADFPVIANEDMKLKVTLEDLRMFEIQVKKDDYLAIVEVTSTREVDEMIKDPEGFVKRKMTIGAENPMIDLENHAALYKVKLGVVGVFVYDPEMLLLKKGKGILDVIGGVKNPYLETFFFNGDNWVRVVGIEVG